MFQKPLWTARSRSIESSAPVFSRRFTSLVRELIARGLVAERQVVVELKAIDQVLPIHRAQVLTYLKLSKLRVALLINFNVTPLKNGIQRFAL